MTVIIYVSFEDILVLFGLQRLNFLFDHCTYVNSLAMTTFPKKNALMCTKKVKLITL